MISISQKLVRPVSEYARGVRARCAGLVHAAGGTGVWVWRKRAGKYVRPARHNGMKLNESQVRWIVREKRRGGLANARIAESMNISVRWVQRLSARHGDRPARDVSHPAPMGRPHNGLPGRREHSAVLSARTSEHLGAASLRIRIRQRTGMNIPKHVIHGILRDEGMARDKPGRRRRRKWVRYERTYSNSLWHTDRRQIRGGMHDGRWFLSYEDDASRLVTGYGVFDEATAENALEVLDEAIERHGRPASVMTDHGSRSYANERKGAERGQAKFEERLAGLGIRQVLAGVNHPQTNGKPGRLHGEIERKLHESGVIMMRRSDPMDLFVTWYNHDRPHMSLDWESQETPAQAFSRKMPPEGQAVVDEVTGEEYHAR